MLIGAVVLVAHGEEADASIPVAGHHRVVGQLHHAVVELDRHRAEARIAAARRREATLLLLPERIGGALGERGHQARLDVLGERLHGREEAARLVHPLHVAQVDLRRELRHVVHEQTGHVDDRGAVFRIGHDVERLEDCRDRRRLDGNRLVRAVGGPQVVLHVAQQHPVVPLVPPNNAVLGLQPAVAVAGLRLGDLCDPDELAAELGLRDLVVELVLDPVRSEHALARLRVFRNHLVIRLELALFFLLLFAFRGLFGSFLLAFLWRRRRRHLFLGHRGRRRQDESGKEHHQDRPDRGPGTHRELRGLRRRQAKKSTTVRCQRARPCPRDPGCRRDLVPGDSV